MIPYRSCENKPSIGVFSFYLSKNPSMSRVCQMTGRGTKSGHSRSHSNIATKRKFKINLQTKRINGVKVRLSTKAIRTLAKQQAA